MSTVIYFQNEAYTCSVNASSVSWTHTVTIKTVYDKFLCKNKGPSLCLMISYLRLVNGKMCFSLPFASSLSHCHSH